MSELPQMRAAKLILGVCSAVVMMTWLACSSKQTSRSTSGGGTGGVAGAAGSGGSAGSASGGTAGTAGGNGGTAGSAGSSGAAGSSSDAGSDAGPVCTVFSFVPDPPKASAFTVTFASSVGYTDVELSVSCGTPASITPVKAACTPDCEWVYDVTGCTAGLSHIAFLSDVKGGSTGVVRAECDVLLQ